MKNIVLWLCHITMLTLAMRCIIDAFHNHGFGLPFSYFMAAMISLPLYLGQVLYFKYNVKN